MEESIYNIPRKNAEGEERLLREARMGIFRQEITNLAIHSPVLRGIDVQRLTEIDFALFERFKKGELSLEQINRQRRVILRLKEAEDSKKLLKYMAKCFLKT